MENGGSSSGIKSEPRGGISLEIGGLELVSHWLIVGVRRTEELVFARRRTTTSRFYSWQRGRSDIFRATISTVRFRAFLPTGRAGQRTNEDTGEDDPFPPITRGPPYDPSQISQAKLILNRSVDFSVYDIFLLLFVYSTIFLTLS